MLTPSLASAVSAKRKASWPPFHEIPDDGTSTRQDPPCCDLVGKEPLAGSGAVAGECVNLIARYAIWSYDLADEQWRSHR